jgi:hypothetical protein
MVGNDHKYNLRWPTSGEIDIPEMYGGTVNNYTGDLILNRYFVYFVYLAVDSHFCFTITTTGQAAESGSSFCSYFILFI